MKLLFGGSPCTFWSIAQKNSRETEAEGMGWELFKNYLIARDKFSPDYFLYENNKSMARAIRDQIDREFTRPYTDSEDWVLVEHTDTKELTRWVFQHWLTCETVQISRILINSALLSAQNRERYYWTNIPGVWHPADLGILLRDVLETGEGWTDKSYALTTRCQGAIPSDTLKRHLHTMVAEPVGIAACGKAHTLKAQYYKNGVADFITNGGYPASAVAEPVAVDLQVVGRKRNSDGAFERTYEGRTDKKSACITSVDSRRMVAEPVGGRMVGRRINEAGHRDDYNPELEHFQRFEVNQDPSKTNTVTTVQKDNMVAEPVRAGCLPSPNGEVKNGRGNRAYSIDGKAVAQTASSGGMGSKTGLYAIPVEFDGDVPISAVSCADGKTYPVYEVKDGKITIKDKTYPIKLADGFYIIRKLTVTECKRLQTVPDDYFFPVSDTQAYKMLGNGWTVDVIAHLLSHAPGITEEPLEVLSMYDGMSCGHIALNKMGATVAKYYATEIDKYAVQTTQHNFPDTIQIGDAFQMRETARQAI